MKFTDSFIAITHIYEIQGNYSKAIEKLQEIIVLLENDWKINMDEADDFFRREIERLKSMQNKQV